MLAQRDTANQPALLWTGLNSFGLALGTRPKNHFPWSSASSWILWRLFGNKSWVVLIKTMITHARRKGSSLIVASLQLFQKLIRWHKIHTATGKGRKEQEVSEANSHNCRQTPRATNKSALKSIYSSNWVWLQEGSCDPSCLQPRSRFWPPFEETRTRDLAPKAKVLSGLRLSAGKSSVLLQLSQEKSQWQKQFLLF